VKQFSGRELISAETSSINLDKEEVKDEKKDDAVKSESDNTSKLTDTEADELCGWLTVNLGDKKVRKVKTTNRLSDSPAIVTDHESGAMRRMLKMVDQANAGRYSETPPQVLEINPKHPIIISLYRSYKNKNDASELISKLVAEQVYDNALVAAGLLDDPRSMLPRLNDILKQTLK
jgi:HSP90 family molecular chaperone